MKKTTVGSGPARVRDVDNPARRAFQTSIHLTIKPGDLSAGASFAVPAGSYLVIEGVTTHAALFPGQAAEFFISTQVGGTSVQHYLPGAGQTLQFPPDQLDEAVNALLVRFYADPDTAVAIGMRRNSTDRDAAADLTVSGYVDARREGPMATKKASKGKIRPPKKKKK